MTYHNTTNLTGEELKRAERKALSQKQKVLQFFKDNPNGSYTPFEVQSRVNPIWPITSVRRAMSDLTPVDLIRTDKKKEGLYGAKNYCWRLREETKNMFEPFQSRIDRLSKQIRLYD